MNMTDVIDGMPAVNALCLLRIRISGDGFAANAYEFGKWDGKDWITVLPDAYVNGKFEESERVGWDNEIEEHHSHVTGWELVPAEVTA